jgi:predicted CXXCH cytochrome family protein
MERVQVKIKRAQSSKGRRHKVFCDNLKTGMFLICTSILIFITGCDKYTRHKVLTFFFTGVPPLEEEKKPVIEEKVEEVQQIKKRKKPDLRVVSFSHGPFASGQCYQCHEISSTVGFRRFGEKAGVRVRTIQQIPGRLVTPLEELCIECHTSKSLTTAYSRGLWTHGPVANGDCTVCHNPHRSFFQYMLLKEKSTELCAECHAGGYLMQIEEHKKDKECITCHNPHVGKDRFLLKKDFNEVF